jgi:lipoprotein NlpI
LQPRGPEALEQRAWNLMYLGGRGEEAAASARQCLEVIGWRAKVSPFMGLLAYFGYRQAGREAEAREMLEEAAKNCSTEGWPCQILKYLRGELSAEELLALADEPGKKTEARTYLGIELLLKGKSREARAHFAWVKEYGSKQYLEFPLAVAELKRLGEN